MAESNIIGRKDELKILRQISNSKESEFLAVYGRRRVGKTFLVREFFSNKGLYFELTGQKNGSLQEQLENFSREFSQAFFEGAPIQIPKNWKEAFFFLTTQFQKQKKNEKIILFLDELPWLATNRSGLLQAIDYYWNRHWSSFKNIVLIVCGSAASWMLEHLINAKGGLHNRLTHKILLKPFTLKGTKEFLQSRGVEMHHKMLCELYMVFGGIPYYLKQVLKGKSSVQTINKICFQKNGLLYGEFDNLFKSLFDNAEIHLSIIKIINLRASGISREELINKLKIKSGGTLNQRLMELEAAGFIQRYVPYGNKKKYYFYRIIDEYVLFYLRWIEPLKLKGVEMKSYWQAKSRSPEALAWAGNAFEIICLKHVDQIKTALELDEVSCEIGSWRYVPKKGSSKMGAQIDLLFDRDDGIVTMCEIKYSDKVFKIDKSYARQLEGKVEIFREHFVTKKNVDIALITVNGLKQNMYSEDLIHNEVIFEDLIQ